MHLLATVLYIQLKRTLLHSYEGTVHKVYCYQQLMYSRLAILLTTADAQRVILLPKSYVHEVILLPRTDAEQVILLPKADLQQVRYIANNN